MWTNFAKYGNPTPNADSTLPFKWDPVTRHTKTQEFVLNYLEIANEKIAMQLNPDEKRIQFWRDMYRKWNGDFLKAKL